jgi:PEP-CTERM motif
MIVTTVVRWLRRRTLIGLVAGTGFLMAGSAQAAPLLMENFDNIGTLAGAGWTLTNNSAALGSTGWFQGDDSVFTSQAGASDAYIAANFNNAGFGGDISNWLISPILTLENGETLAFYTRTEAGGAPFNDHLEVRLSTNSGSSNVGTTATSVGDFTTLLLTVNPLLNGSYPESWTQFTATISGLGAPVSGRLAFRYDVADTSVNADYIGIDTVSVTASPVPEPATLTMLGIGLAGLNLRRRHAARRV